MQNSATEFLTPRNIDVTSYNPNHAKVVLEPLERGFGHTLGNALRRILLSSMSGCAIIEVEIDGVEHEYSAIEGVQEDVMEILLNLKGVAVVMEGRDDTTVSLNVQGPGPVTAGDIESDGHIEVINPEHVIANISGKTSLNMQLRIVRGRGYQPSDARVSDEETRSIGRLQLDATFSPIFKVSYSVENARVENRTDLDKLVLELETNGTIDPEEAIRRSATILQQQMAVFVDLEGETAAEPEEKEEEISPEEKALDSSVEAYPEDEPSQSTETTGDNRPERFGTLKETQRPSQRAVEEFRPSTDGKRAAPKKRVRSEDRPVTLTKPPKKKGFFGWLKSLFSSEEETPKPTGRRNNKRGPNQRRRRPNGQNRGPRENNGERSNNRQRGGRNRNRGPRNNAEGRNRDDRDPREGGNRRRRRRPQGERRESPSE